MVLNVWYIFRLKTYAKYHNLLAKSDILLSADALQKFTETGFECFNLKSCCTIVMVCQLANFSNVHINKRFSYIPHKYNKQKWIFMMKIKCVVFRWSIKWRRKINFISHNAETVNLWKHAEIWSRMSKTLYEIQTIYQLALGNMCGTESILGPCCKTIRNKLYTKAGKQKIWYQISFIRNIMHSVLNICNWI